MTKVLLFIIMILVRYMKLAFLILLNKFITLGCKLLGKNGTVLPGNIIYDHFDKKILEKIKYPKLVIAVTGSSGKGSTVFLINHILTKSGYSVAYNNSGSNGVLAATTLILNNCDIKGNFKKDVLLLEMDERHLKLVFTKHKPTHLIITNITRDQPVRNTSPYVVFNDIKQGIGKNTHLIINADDAIVNEISLNYKHVTTYGVAKTKDSYKKSRLQVADQAYCPVCHTKLIYDYYHYGHLGSYYCPNNDYQRGKPDYEAKNVDLNKKVMKINNETIKLDNDVLYACYYELAAYTLGKVLNIDDKILIDSFNKDALEHKRGKKYHIGSREIIMLESKNENNLSYYQSLRYIKNYKEKKSVILGFNNVSRRYKENDLSWLYDTEFELLNDENIDKIFCIGRFRYDVALRLEYAKVDKHKIILVDDLNELINLVKKKSKGTIFTMVCFDMTQIIKSLIEGDKNEDI